MAIRFLTKQQAAKLRAKKAADRTEAARRQLIRLCDVRYPLDRLLPNNASGRAWVIALIRCGGERAALSSAPWAEKELLALRSAAKRVRFIDLGKMVRLTDAERQRYKVWTLRPYNKPWDKVQWETAERKRERDRVRRREIRRQQKEDEAKMQITSPREHAVLLVLSSKVWMPLSDLTKQAGVCETFRRPDRDLVNPNGLRKLVHIALHKLVERGVAETRLRPGQRGMVCEARRKANPPQEGVTGDHFFDGETGKTKKSPKPKAAQRLRRKSGRVARNKYPGDAVSHPLRE